MAVVWPRAKYSEQAATNNFLVNDRGVVFRVFSPYFLQWSFFKQIACYVLDLPSDGFLTSNLITRIVLFWQIDYSNRVPFFVALHRSSFDPELM